MEDKKPNTPSNSNENMSTYPISPPPISTKNFHGINGVNITSPQIASLRLKPAKSTDSLTNHPLQNFDDEESDVNSIWSSQRSLPSDSVGGLMLTKLRELNLDFSGIVQMLIAKKATLLLPTSPVMPFEQIDLTFLEDHVIVSQPSEDGQKVIGLVPPEPEISTYIKENSKTRKSIFDTIIKPIDLSYDYPSIEIINKNVDILFEGMTIQIIVIDSPIRAKEVAERIAAHKAEEFKVKNEETSIDKIQGLFYSLGDQFELQAELNEEKQDDNENEIDKSMNIVEKYVCTVLYDLIFCPKWSDDNLQDDILGSKIAALNFCKLCLLHLGVDVNLQQEQIDMVVKTAGRELQNLDQMKAPYEKLDTLIRCHRIVVDELDDTTKIVQDAPTVPSSATSPQASDSPTVPTSATLPQASDSPTVPTSATLPEASDSPTVPTSATLPEASDSPTVPTSATLPQASDSPTMPTSATLPQASDSPT
ncbi:8078_t:CDS:2, partial [Scutellospora calospora]